MAEKDLRQAANEAEKRAAQQIVEARPVVTEAELAEVIDVNAVDEYVEATGEYPLSGDLAEGDVVDEGMATDVAVRGLDADIRTMPGHRKDERA